MKYRKEIDGLRAVAVVPVILFHAGFESFSGGYVGVDVFFVISGYLITTIILTAKEQGTFSLLYFYERRARRILPALFLILLVCLPAAWLWLLPSDMESFSRSLMAVSTFSSNILFWREAGYWDVASELKPLLHTWSLAVEEQYYLLFPLFLMVMWRLGNRWMFGSFVLVTVLSLMLAQQWAFVRPSAAFFLLPTRGWELAIGAGIAFYFLYCKKVIRTLLSHRPVDEVMSLVGLLMIGYAVFVFDETVPFPGFYALIPTIGTGLIILFSSPRTIVGRLLGTKLLVGIGLISYSTYLWHYPLLAFARHRSLTEPSELVFLVLAFLSFPFAFLSWRYVERPFRRKGVFSRKTIFTFAFIGSVFFISIGLAGYLTNGWPDRLDERLTEALPAEGDTLHCVSPEFQSGKVCDLVRSPNKLAFLIGDSHAGAVAPEMQTAFARDNIGLLHITKNGCLPVQNVYRADGGNTTDLSCYRFNKKLFDYIKENKDIEYVIVMARWALLIEGSRFDNKEGGIEPTFQNPHLDLVVNGKPEYHPAYDHRAELSARYADSIRALLDMGKKVILVYPVPEAGWNVPRYLSKFYMTNPQQAFSPKAGSTSYEVFKERNRRSYAALDSVGQQPNLFRVYPEKVFCNNDVKDRCIVQKDGRFLYKDDDHLSNAGAKLIVEKILQQME